MCGRFTQRYTWAEIVAFLRVFAPPDATPNLRPRYNTAPTTEIEVVVPTDKGRELVRMRWGMVPYWWKKSLKELPATFNARADSVADKPMFGDSFRRRRRCIIRPAVSMSGRGRRPIASPGISPRRAANHWRSPVSGTRGAIPRQATASSSS